MSHMKEWRKESVRGEKQSSGLEAASGRARGSGSAVLTRETRETFGRNQPDPRESSEKRAAGGDDRARFSSTRDRI